MNRRAVVAGAGYAGLTAAVALLQRGWRVHVVERAASIRSEGYSIAFHENGLRTLEALGLLERALEQAAPMPARQTRDRRGRVTSSFDADYRVVRIARPHLVGLLAEEATRLGGRIACGAAAMAAEPSGRLRLADGAMIEGDLIVAADGVMSPLRDGLGLLDRIEESREGALRAVLTRVPGEMGPDDDGRTGFEFWSGRRRFMYRVAAAGSAYLTFTARDDDAAARRLPLDAALWGAAFPTCAEVIARAARDVDWSATRWAPFRTVRLAAWSRGRVAVVGDAAHAMAPNLAQGGNCAMMNALALAHHVDAAEDVAAGLSEWERVERPVIEHTQRWSRRFTAPQALPEWLWTRLLPPLARSRWVREAVTRAPRRAPTGWPAVIAAAGAGSRNVAPRTP